MLLTPYRVLDLTDQRGMLTGQILADLGAEIHEVSLPTTEYALACYYIIAPSECSANLARYDGVKYGYSYRGDGQSDGDMWEAMERTRQHGFGPEVKRRIMLGAFALSSGYYDAYYRKAERVRRLIRNDFASAFEHVDVIAGPTSPHVAFAHGAKADPVQMYLEDIFTIAVNLAGLPGISIPAGMENGLPFGLQIIGPDFAEARVLNVAHQFQQMTDWHLRVPESAALEGH